MCLVHFITHPIVNRPLERIPKMLRTSYFSCFPKPFSVSGQISFSRGWKGRGIWYSDQVNETAGMQKQIPAEIFSGAPRLADACWLCSGTDDAPPVHPAVTSAVANRTTARQQMENKPIRKTRVLQPDRQQLMIFVS